MGFLGRGPLLKGGFFPFWSPNVGFWGGLPPFQSKKIPNSQLKRSLGELGGPLKIVGVGKPP